MNESTGRSAYIVASKGMNILPLVEALSRKGVSTATSPVLLGQSHSLQDVIAAIRAADMVIGVLWERDPDLNLIVELGVAAGFECPILLFGSESSKIPSNLRSSVAVVRMGLWDDLLFHTHLDPFLEKLSSSKARSEPQTQPELARQAQHRRDFDAALTLFRTMESMGRPPAESEAEQLLATLFRASGYIASVKEQRHQTGFGWLRPDLAVWVEDLPHDMGSPLLIEIAFHRVMAHQRREQFQRLLREFNTKGGLIVTWGEPKLPEAIGRPNDLWVPIMSVREVVDALKLGVFAEVYLRRATVGA